MATRTRLKELLCFVLVLCITSFDNVIGQSGDGETVAVFLSVTLTGETFNERLNIKTSTEYISLKDSLEEAIDAETKAEMDSRGYSYSSIKSNVRNLKSGSVIAEFEVTVEGTTASSQQVVTATKATSSDSTIGSFAVNQIQDVDECENTASNNCDANASCQNIEGSFTCACKTGYTGSGVTCADIDECSLNTHDCHNQSSCSNNNGSFTCTCLSGYTGDGKNCTDIDLCDASSPCHSDAVCVNVAGSGTCVCNTGFTGDGSSCVDIDECSDASSCDEKATCANNNGSFTCTCQAGYSGDGSSCVDMDECTSGSNDCDSNAICTNNPGGFSCACKPGFTGGGKSCSDINECTDGSNNCNTNADCSNKDGSFTCACKSGFNGDGISCEDVDECASPETNNCHENAICSNIPGSFSCACKAGYTGDGTTTCTNINECDAGTDNCNANADCTDTEGSFTCKCKTGFSGNGVDCEDINECDLGTDDCSPVPRGVCTNQPGTFTCSCAENHAGDGKNCQEIEVLPAPNEISVAESIAKVELISERRHKNYEIQVRRVGSGDSGITFNFVDSESSMVVDIDNLESGTEYEVRARVRVLQNGFEVTPDYSPILYITTDYPEESASVSVNQVFISSYNNINSQESITFISSITTIMMQSSTIIISVQVYYLFPGSVQALMDVKTNNTANQTLENAISDNSNLSVTVLPKESNPPPPENVTVTDVTTSQFSIQWSPVENAFEYQVFVKYSGSNQTYSTNDTSFTVSALPANTPIVASVRAVVKNGTAYRFSNSSAEIVFNTKSEGPANLMATVLTGTVIIIKFDKVKTAETYYISIKNNPEFDFTLTADSEVNGTFSKEIDGLMANTSYTIGAIATVGSANSTESTISATTGPETVSGIAIYNVTKDGFNFEHDNVNILPAISTSYVIKYMSSGGSQEQNTDASDTFIAAVNPATTEYNVSAAYKTTKMSPFSSSISSKIWTVTLVTNDSISFSWDSYKDATSYTISSSSGSTYIETQPSTAFTSLTPGIEYRLKVSIEDKLLFDVPQFTCPPAAANLACKPKTSECITVTWNEAVSATSYVASAVENQFAIVTVSFADRSAEICNLTSGNKYTINLKTVNRACESDVASVPDCITDVDECAGANDCPAESQCQNTIGSYACVCKPGFTGNGTVCTNINECTSGTHNCSNNGQCNDNDGGFTCACFDGFTGDGFTCTDINECVTLNDCDTKAECLNTAGTYSCRCNDGYSGNGKSCADVDECGLSTIPCDTNANCANTPGNYTCTCKSGFTGNGTVCNDNDECASESTNNCARNTNCTNLSGNYSCECKTGFDGDPYKPGTCQEIEKLPPPIGYAVYTTSVYFRINSSLPHQEYSVIIYEADGTVKETTTTATQFASFSSLSEGTKYTITVKITKLQNGAVVTAGPESDVLNVETSRSSIKVLIVLTDETYTSSLTDRSSTEFTDMYNIFKSRFEEIHPNDAISFEVLGFFAGSVEALTEIVQNTSSTATIPGATLTSGTISQSATLATAPAGLSLTSDSSNSLTAEWNAVTGGSVSYILEVQCETTTTHYTTLTSFSVSGLSPNTACAATVRAVVNTQVTVSSAVKTVTTLAAGPTISATVLSATSIRVAIDAVSGADKYYVTVNDTSDPIDTFTAADVIDNKLSKDITGLTPASALLITVSAEISGVNGTESTATVTLGPNTVSGLILFNITNNGFDVVFDAVSLEGGASVSHIVKYIPVTGTGTAISVETSSNTVHIASDPITTPYNVSVAYKSNSVDSAFSSVVSTKVYNIDAVAADSIELRWNAVPNNLGITFSSLITSGGASQDKLLRDLTRTFTSLTAGTKYTMKVTMLISAFSTSVTYFEISQLTIPDQVKNLQCKPSTETCFSLTWDADSATTYASEINQGTATGVEVTVNNTKPGAEVCNVATGSLYNASVTATNTAGSGVAATIQNCYSVLPGPTNVNIKVDNQTCFTISWNAISNANSYTATLRSSTATSMSETSTSNSVQICGLEVATLYNASVNATYEAGESLPSNDVVSQITAPSAPSLSFVTATTTSITLSWIKSSTAQTYHIQTTQTAPTATAAMIHSTTSTTLTINDLQPGHEYDFVIMAENAGGNSTMSATLKQITIPGSVPNFQVDTANVAQLSIPFTWTEVTGALNYVVSVTKDGTEVSTANPTASPWSGITNLNDGESYNISIYAVSKAVGVTQNGAPVSISFETAPPVPTNIVPNSITTNSMQFTWNDSKGATGYDVILKQKTPDGPSQNVTTSTAMQSFSSLTAGYVYTITIRSKNTGGFSLASAGVDQITVPSPVQDLQLRNGSSQTSFRLQWTTATGAATYDVTLTKSDGTGTPVSKPVSDGFADFGSSEGITAGTNYTVSVVAKTSTADGIQQASESTQYTFSTAPLDPNTPTEDSSTETTITFSWTPDATGAKFYEVEVLDGSTTVQKVNVTGTTTTITGLTSGTQYTIQIRAINDFGSSQTISGTLSTRPGSPDFNTTDITTNSIKLVWLAIPGAQAYSVGAKRTSDNVAISVSPNYIRVPIIETTITGLSAGTNYTITMTTRGGFRDSADNSKIQITVPEAPTVTLATRATDAFQFTWNMITGADNFIVSYKKLTDASTTDLTVNNMSYTISSLESGTAYMIAIKSANSAGSNGSPVEYNTVISAGQPAVTISSETTDGFTVSFPEVPDRNNFDVVVTPGPKTVSTSTNSAVINGLSPGTTYSVTVFVNYKTVGRSSGSTAVSATTLAVAPTNFAVSSNTQNEGITLSWTEVSGATNYQITATTSTGSLSYNYTTSPQLIPTVLGSVYNFSVRTINSDAMLGPAATLDSISAAAVKVFDLEITLNSTYTYSSNLADKTSSEFSQLQIIVVNALTIILNNWSGFVKIEVNEFLNGSVVSRTSLTSSSPSDTATSVANLYTTSTADKTTFTTSGLTTDINECINSPSPCDKNADCVNTPDAYTCTCKTGYTGNGQTCTNIDECSGTSPCHAEATCQDQPGTYICTCNTGYTGNGTTCSDVNECPSACSGTSTCENTVGSYKCNCESGYTYSGTTCVDDDECSTSTPCDTNAQCANIPGSFTCSCKTGYTGNGVTCSDLDECSSTPGVCTANQVCTNNPGSYTCPCKTGFVENAAKTDCVDQNECTTNPCHAAASCLNNVGSYTCTCNSGFSGSGSSTGDGCVDINECLDDTLCKANETCTNTSPGYFCSCKVGFSGDVSTSCIDIDECASANPCQPNGVCSNSVGSYYCTCNSGYFDNAGSCDDIDECSSNINVCSDRANCVNEIGSFRCDCKPGFSGSDNVCVDIDECLASPDPCSTVLNTVCVNRMGNFSCDCKPGYSLIGLACTNINECELTPNPCASDRVCVDNEGSYSCDCQPGFSGTKCDDVNECSLGADNCNANADCANTIGSFSCSCKQYYAGDGVTCTANITTVYIEQTITKYEYSAQLTRATTTEPELSAEVKKQVELQFPGFTFVSVVFTSGAGTSINALYVIQTLMPVTSPILSYYLPNVGDTTLFATTPVLAQSCSSTTCSAREYCFELNSVQTCVCRAGYSGNDCADIDECTTSNSCNSLATCGNTEGSYTCTCQTGYEGDGTVCSDIDECLTVTCSANSGCVNNAGSYECECNTGYTGDGTTCTDIDECSTVTCFTNSQCKNNAGSYQCECNDGYRSDGTACFDIDECLTETCFTNSECKNSEGSYRCVCNAGYMLNSNNSTCIAQCTEAYCNNGGTCVPSTDSDTPTCLCTSQFQGTKCDESSIYRDLAIAFGVIGGILLILLIAAIIVCIVRRKRNNMDFVP
uniref:serine-rich adhesin for platelets-like n=1 Tax=Styela clava TaxID=7725 RepID=UPI00193A3E29|nr:serine-rich adhesin for platelets-like [Styela clava]